MPKSLLIVESPTKAKTLKKYLGSQYTIKASVGHLKDLPKNKLGVNIENDFQPEYITIRGKGGVLKELREAARKADKIYLAPDPDREGEAIAWHISNELSQISKENIYRVLINEFTPKSISQALKNPDRIDEDKVNAQQARRILDRLVGYKISPLLWRKVNRGLSAGRVQSVALRLICEREKEIASFVSEEYWSIIAHLESGTPPPFQAKLQKIDGKKAEIKNGGDAEKIARDLKEKEFIVEEIERKKREKRPVPPFITSTLQQEASRKLGFSVKKTMVIAQQLYEGIDLKDRGTVGLITYMRTDSNRIAQEARKEARDLITKRYGGEYIPKKPPVYKSKKGSQEAHEAVRPSLPLHSPEEVKPFLSRDQYSLYTLIWNRFLASQMSPAVIDSTKVFIRADQYLFQASGSVIIFQGYTKIYEEGKDNGKKTNANDKDAILPDLKKDESLRLMGMDTNQHFTQPPPRFTEAALVKELEDKGIGRPSTYATILNNIRERDYVKLEEKRFHPTELGQIVIELLVESFPRVMDVKFTAEMESQLDKVEEGNKGWVETLKEFYLPFSQNLDRAEKNMKNLKKEVELTDILCDMCGKRMVIKWGRYGKFYACEAFPECKNTRPIKEEGQQEKKTERESDEKCEKCGSAMLIKQGRYGDFLACSKYPKCKYTKSMTIGVSCPEEECNGNLVERRTKSGRPFYGCSKYPKCKFAIWEKPLPESCPHCDHPFLVLKWDSRKRKNFIACPQKECKYKEENEGQKSKRM